MKTPCPAADMDARFHELVSRELMGEETSVKGLVRP
jgi:hypothetical protein